VVARVLQLVLDGGVKLIKFDGFNSRKQLTSEFSVLQLFYQSHQIVFVVLHHRFAKTEFVNDALVERNLPLGLLWVGYLLRDLHPGCLKPVFVG